MPLTGSLNSPVFREQARYSAKVAPIASEQR